MFCVSYVRFDNEVGVNLFYTNGL